MCVHLALGSLSTDLGHGPGRLWDETSQASDSVPASAENPKSFVCRCGQVMSSRNYAHPESRSEANRVLVCNQDNSICIDWHLPSRLVAEKPSFPGWWKGWRQVCLPLLIEFVKLLPLLRKGQMPPVQPGPMKVLMRAMMILGYVAWLWES
eukprot:s244_g15.t1